MKSKLLNKIWLRSLAVVAVMTTAFAGQTWGEDQTWTWNASSGALGDKIGSGNFTSNDIEWNYTRTLISGTSYTGWTSNCIQLGKNGGVENITLSTRNIPGIIKKVSVECSSYSAAHKVAITVGGTTYLASTATSSWTTVSKKEGTGNSSGEIVISFTDGSRALYIKSISVIYSTSSGPEITANNITINYNVTSGTIPYTIENGVQGTTLTASTNATWLTLGSVGESSIPFTCSQNESEADRTATVTLSYEGAQDVSITVTQKRYVVDFASLPFSYNQGKASIEGTVGLTQSGLGSDYSSAPYLKFDNQNDYLILKINERPGMLTFDIKGNGFSGGTFKVQTSEDGENYSDLQIYTELDASVQSEEFRNLGADVRYIKWIYSEKGSGNVALGNINLAQYVAPQNYTVSWTAGDNTELFVFAGDESEAIENGASVPEWTTVMVSVDVADGYELGALTVKDADDNEIDLTSIGENYYSFEMPSSDVTITSNATLLPERPTVPVAGGQYVKVTSGDNLEDGYYLIVYEGGSLALNGGIANNLDMVSNFVGVTIQDDIINATTETNNAAFFYNTTNKTLQGVGGLYIGQTSDANGLKSSSDTSYENTISIDNDGNAAIVSGGAYLRYNSANDQTRFRYFKSSSYTSQKAIQIYKYVAPAPVTASVTSAGWATFSSTRALDFTNVTGVVANTAVYANGRLTYTPIQQVPANTGVILHSVSGGEASVDVPVINDIPALEEGSNMLVAVGTAISSLATVGDNNSTNYILNNVNGVLGFYRAAGNRVDAGKAYLNVPAGASRSFIDINPGEQDGIESVNVNAAEDNIYDLQGRQVAQPQKGLYIVNGKKVVIK